MGVRLAVALLLVAVLWSLGRPGTVGLRERADPDRDASALEVPEGLAAEPRGGSIGLDPEPHRAAIERIESVLYRRAPGGFGDAGAVESGAARLAEDLLRGDGLRGRRAGTLLLGFAGRVGARSDVGYARPSLVALRNEWEAVRDQVFHPAGWMRSADAGLDRIQEPPPPAMDARAPHALGGAERELRRLLAQGQREVERLGEPVYDPDRPQWSDHGQIRAWYAWGERWRSQLAAAMEPVRSLSPRPDFAREPLHAEAARALDEAHEQLRRIPDGAGMWPTPFRPAWEARFRTASDALARARTTLARAGHETAATAAAR